jgi:hypothetical protein
VQIFQQSLAVPSIILLHAGVIRTDDNLWSCYSISFTHQSTMSSRMTIMEELKWKHVVLTFYWVSVWVFLLQLEDSCNQHDPFPIRQTTGNLLYCWNILRNWYPSVRCSLRSKPLSEVKGSTPEARKCCCFLYWELFCEWSVERTNSLMQIYCLFIIYLTVLLVDQATSIDTEWRISE